MKNELEKLLNTAYNDADDIVQIFDPRHDGIHLEAVIVSSRFENKSRLEQHRDVMQHLSEAFNTNTIHALGLKTYTPTQWKKKQDNH